ncbi:NB-ARC domain-containing protein [Clostridium chromiireducens]|uniref:alpha/beta hydrolase n=1 Tax=Clostridium chromiireducens TaxID=225345 RepID=UPI0013652CAD|nr:NB-ARC domain-containing protein [Clostridium chromiireducens]
MLSLKIDIPKERQNKNNTILVVLIHGLGAPDTTWENNDTSWTKLLLGDSDLEMIDVGVVKYDTAHISSNTANVLNKIQNVVTAGKGPFTSLEVLIRELKEELNSDKVKQYEKIMFVTHSMGGLIGMRYILDEFNRNQKININEFISMATPYNGADLAKVYESLPFFKSHEQIKSLKTNSNFIDDTIRLLVKYNDKLKNECNFTFCYATNDEYVSRESAIPPIVDSKWEGEPLGGSHSGILNVNLHNSRAYDVVKKRILNLIQNKVHEEKHLLQVNGNCNHNIIHNTLIESVEYTYREILDKDISSQLKEKKVSVITGPGGIGKTQLAANYVNNYRHKYNLIGWINASDAISIQNSYFELVKQLDLVFWKDNFDNQKAILEYMKSWLENNSEWLMIYDNVKNHKELNDLLPSFWNGHIIITSQNAKWSKFKPTIEVPKLSNKESIDFLMKRAEKNYEPEMEELVELLDKFPLALEHAAAYVYKTSRTFAYYLKMFKERQREILCNAKKPEDYEYTIATTWDIAFNEISSVCPDAIKFIYFISFLAPDDIPLDMIKFKDENNLYSIIKILEDDL